MILIGQLEALYNIYTYFTKKKAKLKIPKCETKKNVLVTGGTKGIGKCIVEKLVSNGYFLILLSRDTNMMENLKQKYGEDCIDFAFLDLSNIKSISKIVKNIVKEKRIDLVINNASAYYRKIHFKYGIEYNFLINHVGHYILVESIKDNIDGRIVNVSSSAMYAATNIEFAKRIDFLMDNYSKSKYANALHSLMLKNQGYEAVSVHPGIIATNLFNNTYYGRFVCKLYQVAPFLFTSVDDASDNVLFACFTEKLHKSKNKPDFYMNRRRAKASNYVNIVNASALETYTRIVCKQNKVEL
ncbi:hypothetical protein BDAP_001488 [Binucleata daphniae]